MHFSEHWWVQRENFSIKGLKLLQASIFFALLSHKNTKGKVIRIRKAVYDNINGVWSCANSKNYSLSKQMVI